MNDFESWIVNALMVGLVVLIFALALTALRAALFGGIPFCQ